MEPSRATLRRAALAAALVALAAVALPRAVGARPGAQPHGTGAFLGEVTARRHVVVDPGDGTQLVMTALTLSGTSLAEWPDDGPPHAPRELELWFPGGVLSEDLGSFVADAPPRHATRVGRLVLALHRPSEHFGTTPGGEVLAGQVLAGGGAGLFTAFRATTGAVVVQGRPGTTLPRNVHVPAARAMISALLDAALDPRPRPAPR